MLKTIACLALLLALCAASLSAQTKERDVLANAGGTATISSAGNNYTVSWTLGETFVATRQSTSPALIITEGFQQPDSGIVPTIELPNALGQVTIAPNPAGDALHISLSALPTAPLRAALLDLSGRTLREAALTDVRTTLDLRGLPAAGYVLSITDGKGWVKAVQVVKQ